MEWLVNWISAFMVRIGLLSPPEDRQLSKEIEQLEETYAHVLSSESFRGKQKTNVGLVKRAVKEITSTNDGGYFKPTYFCAGDAFEDSSITIDTSFDVFLRLKMPSASKVDADGLQNDGPQMEACTEGWGCIKRGSPQIENEHGYQCTHKARKLLETFIQNSFPGGKTTIKSVGETQLLSVNFDDESAAASIVIKSGKSSKVMTVRLIPLIHADDIDSSSSSTGSKTVDMVAETFDPGHTSSYTDRWKMSTARLETEKLNNMLRDKLKLLKMFKLLIKAQPSLRCLDDNLLKNIFLDIEQEYTDAWCWQGYYFRERFKDMVSALHTALKNKTHPSYFNKDVNCLSLSNATGDAETFLAGVIEGNNFSSLFTTMDLKQTV